MLIAVGKESNDIYVVPSASPLRKNWIATSSLKNSTVFS